MNSSHI